MTGSLRVNRPLNHPGRGTGQTCPSVESPPARGKGWVFRFQVAAACLAASMQSEAPLTLILSPLRAGRGELELTRLGSQFGDRDTVSPMDSPLPLEKGEGQGEGSSRHGYGLLSLLESCVPPHDAGRSLRSSCYDR